MLYGIAVSIKDKYIVRSVNAEDTKEWLLYKHYAARMPNIIYAFGLYKCDLLVGVITYGNMASPAPCVGVCGLKYRSIVIELNRLCINDGEDLNAASFFVSSTLKLIQGPKIIISYADTSKNHIGYIYQATNFLYTGLSAKRTDPDHETNNIHNRNSFIKGLPQKERPRKHRYIYFIGTKKEKLLMRAALNYDIEPYPKGDNKRYDASYKPTIQGNLF